MSLSIYPSILWVPDTHDMPEVEQERFKWLGKLIVDRKPDYIIFIGDIADFEALLSHDISAAKKADLAKEIQSLKNALFLSFEPLLSLRERQRKNKQKIYNPKIKIHVGNHEQRVFKFKKENPNLAGLIPDDLFGIKDYDLDISVIHYEGNSPGIDKTEGIYHSHYFTTGSFGQAAGTGKWPAKSLATAKHMPVVQGHNHKRNWYEERGYRVISGLTLGKYFPQYMNYAGQSNADWWSGLTFTYVTDSEWGIYDLEFISIERVEEQYGC